MLAEVQKKKLEALDSIYDADSDRVIQISDFHLLPDRFSDVHGWKAGKPEYDALKSQVSTRWLFIQKATDASGDKRITRSEWLTYVDEMLGSPAAYEAEVTRIADALSSIFDLNNNGQLDLPEYQPLYRTLSLDESLADDIFYRLDLNNGGPITKEEFLELLRQFFYNQAPSSPGNSIFRPH
jgi:juvenile hormone diol kinase